MYVIPEGTSVEVRHLHKEDRPKRIITKNRLEFAESSGSAYGGSILYFSDGEWEIAVNAKKVEK